MRQFTHLIEHCKKRFRIGALFLLFILYHGPIFHLLWFYDRLWFCPTVTTFQYSLCSNMTFHSDHFLMLFNNPRIAVCSILVLYEHLPFGFLLSAFNNMFKTWIISFIAYEALFTVHWFPFWYWLEFLAGCYFSVLRALIIVVGICEKIMSWAKYEIQKLCTIFYHCSECLTILGRFEIF